MAKTKVKEPITYEYVVDKVRKTFEHADARQIFEHIAIEVDIVGEGAGAFYFEVAGRAICVEPYNYYDNDGRITAAADVLIALADKKMTLRKALDKGLVRFEGNEQKLYECLEKVKLR